MTILEQLNNIRIRWKLLILILFIGLSYLIGNWIPSEVFSPQIKVEPINTGEYYRLIISFFSAIITFFAVLVALFKDDLRELWKYPRIVFHRPENITVEITEEEDSPGGEAIIQANKYIARIEVKNVGNLPTMNAEIYLEKLEHKDSATSIISNYIETTGIAMPWNGEGIKSIIIPPGGKKLINLVELTKPIKISLPNSPQTSQPPKLIIGGIENSSEHKKGIWCATFTLNAQNHKPINFILEIEWGGLWKKRLTEMTSQLKIDIKGRK